MTNRFQIQIFTSTWVSIDDVVFIDRGIERRIDVRGDFGSQKERVAYAKRICRLLNAAVKMEKKK